jgi:hypothetical protein
MSSLFNGIIRDGVFANYPAQNQHLTISAGAAVSGHPTVEIGPGRAWFNGTWTDNSAALTLQLDAADNVADRYDAIVLEVNTTNNADNTVSPAVPGRSNGFCVVKGTPGGNYPTVSSGDGIYRYALAYVKVAHGASTVSSIDYKVGTTIPYIVNAVQETWSANDVIARWNQEWAVFLGGLDTSFWEYLEGKDTDWATYLSGKDSAWTAYLAGLNVDVPSMISTEMGKVGRIWLVDKDVSGTSGATQIFARDAQVYPAPANSPNFYPDFYNNSSTVGAHPPIANDVIIGANGYYGVVTSFSGSSENYSMVVTSVGKRIFDLPPEEKEYWVTFSGIDLVDLSDSNPVCDRTLSEIQDAYHDGYKIRTRIEYEFTSQSGGTQYHDTTYVYPQYAIHDNAVAGTTNRIVRSLECNFMDNYTQDPSLVLLVYDSNGIRLSSISFQ